ncbi:hypothetical protein PFLG_01732 [Plasmodium falciparum RAJ116]|uniref:Mitochondrial carrier protein n=1 Tax=Plasmodium falciparum RAJ116 TaxID=580058 RepID=A0A0L0CVX2_PLAFA|nr:hypothetical protein PFLG_01732 [Plasmodium falciparum RAJ116]
MGSIIGCTISKIVLYPLDTIKINKQIYKQPIEKGNNEYKKNLLTYIQNKNKNKNTIFLTCTKVSQRGIICGGCEDLKLKKSSNIIVFFRGKGDFKSFLSEAISCIIFVPIDVIKERLQAQKYLQLKEHKTTSKLIKEYIYKQGLSRLYRGYISTCLSYGMFCGSFFFFQSVNNIKIKCQNIQTFIGHKIMNQLDIESSHYNNLKLNLACSFISGFISSPLDIIRIRYIPKYSNGLKKLCREDNRRIYNLFKGNFYRCCLLSLSMTINFFFSPVLMKREKSNVNI